MTKDASQTLIEFVALQQSPALRAIYSQLLVLGACSREQQIKTASSCTYGARLQQRPLRLLHPGLLLVHQELSRVLWALRGLWEQSVRPGLFAVCLRR